ncbi:MULTISPECIES: Rieske 2Fe-2S domain-containing protein [Rhodococcus]|uniref:Rieske 2Fe-2S domain-containing protein n=1 Tax=unclassified Rhodococcus (in: high G+C Gram-positive bacteria) TaxID=192944 RepID=UPI0012F62722
MPARSTPSTNACRHRGHELLTVDSCTNKRVEHCPNHAWVCELDGELRSTNPRVSIWRIRGFRRSRPRVVAARSIECESIEGGKRPPGGVGDGLARGSPRRGHGSARHPLGPGHVRHAFLHGVRPESGVELVRMAIDNSDQPTAVRTDHHAARSLRVYDASPALRPSLRYRGTGLLSARGDAILHIPIAG